MVIQQLLLGISDLFPMEVRSYRGLFRTTVTFCTHFIYKTPEKKDQNGLQSMLSKGFHSSSSNVSAVAVICLRNGPQRRYGARFL